MVLKEGSLPTLLESLLKESDLLPLHRRIDYIFVHLPGLIC